MSALHPKADIASRQLNVRFVPEADITGFSPQTIRLTQGARPICTAMCNHAPHQNSAKSLAINTWPGKFFFTSSAHDV